MPNKHHPEPAKQPVRVTDPLLCPVESTTEINLFVRGSEKISEATAHLAAQLIVRGLSYMGREGIVTAVGDDRLDIICEGNRIGYVRFTP